MANVEVVKIHNNPAGADTLDKEYIMIKNNTKDQAISMNGWIVSDRTPTGQETHLFYFPEKIEGSTWTLDPGEYIFLMTGKGTDKFYPATQTHSPQFHFHMQRGAFVWNNPGDTAFLRLPNGEIAHWMKVP